MTIKDCIPPLLGKSGDQDHKTTMADPLKQMCDALGVCEEEALFYLEGLRWDLNAAMEACRSKTLPPSENERAAAEERVRNEKIKSFSEWTKTTVEDARNYLSRNNWNVDHAAHAFYKDTENKSKPKPMPLPQDGSTAPWYLQGFSGNQGPDTTQDVLSNVPKFQNTSTNLRIGSPPPSASSPPHEVQQERLKGFVNVVGPEASSKVVVDCLKHCKWNVDDAIMYFYDIDQESELSDKDKEELISSFSGTTGASKQVAKVYMEQYKWNLDRATNLFLDHCLSGEETSALNTGGVENRDVTLPSQSQFDASYVSSGPTETQSSLEEAGEGGDVTVDGKAVEEGSSTETVPDPFANQERTTVETQTAPSTIMITISLADTTGTFLELPFRSDQTIRDIRNAIDQRYPDNDKSYYLQSTAGVDYMDWNITVYKVSKGDSTILVQVYP